MLINKSQIRTVVTIGPDETGTAEYGHVEKKKGIDMMSGHIVAGMILGIAYTEITMDFHAPFRIRALDCLRRVLSVHEPAEQKIYKQRL